jgi:multidrug efflux pump subunit AcrA (membrane-fusion protein)
MGEGQNEVEPRSRWPHRLGQAALALALLAAGMAAGVLWSERRAAATRTATSSPDPATPAPPPSPAPASPAPAAGTASTEPVEVSLTPDAIARIGLKTAVVRQAPGVEGLVVPGTIMPNAYRDTKINALVGGIVRRVSAELGSIVAPGQTLAVIGSQELAEAQMKYLSMQAMLEADHQKLRRTEKLVDLGSASRQELEETTAVHAAHATEAAAARERLAILGLSRQQIERLADASQIVSDVVVVAPAEGVVTARGVNPARWSRQVRNSSSWST